MKTALLVLAAVVGVAGVTADGTNTTTMKSAKGGPEYAYFDCVPPGNGLGYWYYNTRGGTSYQCKEERGQLQNWIMLNAYRAGGTEGLHWKYTDNVNDGECLNNWKYYSSDGQTLIATISGRTTTQNDPRRWCALPVYRPGGVEGKQWGYCRCQWVDNGN